jgi:putative SOS response-associated peptidase YedK
MDLHSPGSSANAIITGEPNELAVPFHNRMPTIVPGEDWSARPSEEPATADEL